MKSERRHELQENELATLIGRANTVIEPYSKLILIVVVAAVVGFVGFGLYRNRITENASDATLQLIQASGNNDVEALAAVAETYPNAPAAAWARLYQADSYLAQGINSLFGDRTEAEDLLNQANEAFQQAIAQSDNRILNSRAQFGLARIGESLGDTQRAIEHYKLCIEAEESQAMMDLAQDRIDALESSSTQDFLTWFGEQDFSPADPSLPPSLPDATGLPSTPNFGLPDLGTTSGIPLSTPSEDAANETAPAAADSEPTGLDVPQNTSEPAEDVAGADDSRSETSRPMRLPSDETGDSIGEATPAEAKSPGTESEQPGLVVPTETATPDAPPSKQDGSAAADDADSDDS